MNTQNGYGLWVVAFLTLLVIALASSQADRAPSSATDKWKVIRVCDRAAWAVPAEYARVIKEGAEKDCGIFPAKKPHPARA